MEKSKVLVFGSTGYMGQRLARASLANGHPTFLFVSSAVASDLRKVQILLGFKLQGAVLIQGNLEDPKSLVSAISKADVVISSLGETQLLKQLFIIDAIKEAGNVKRFLPSEFGMDPDQMEHALQPINVLLTQKRTVRRAVEQAGIPYTYVSANCFAGYFLGGLAEYGFFMPPKKEISVYGDGNCKVVWNVEDDVATYALRAIDDPRTLNTTMYIRPPANILSQAEVIAIWEEVSGRNLEKNVIPEQDFLKRIQGSEFPRNAELACFYHIFYESCLIIDIEKGVEASRLYPDVKYTSVYEYLLQFV